MNWAKSSLHFYKLEIFDRWGNTVYTNELNVGLFDTKGILGDEIKWDGKFNGVVVSPGVYTWVASVESCYDGSNQCNDCTGGSTNFERCGTEGVEVFSGDVTVLL